MTHRESNGHVTERDWWWPWEAKRDLDMFGAIISETAGDRDMMKIEHL